MEVEQKILGWRPSQVLFLEHTWHIKYSTWISMAILVEDSELWVLKKRDIFDR